MAPFFTGLARKSGGFFGGVAKSFVTTIYTIEGTYQYQGDITPTWTTQSIAVPADTTAVKITADGGMNGGSPGANGAWGGFAEATFTSLAGKTLNATIRGGGNGGNFFGSPANNGRHFAGVFDGPVSQPNALVIAGGGGGPAMGAYFSPNFTGPGSGGAGNGGGPSGVQGQFGKHADYPNVPGSAAPPSAGGGGGTQNAGGSGGTGGYGDNGGSGSALQGGTGGNDPNGNVRPGGGGGGGYYGGGGGSGGNNGSYPTIGFSGGGGGSGYIHPSGTLATNTTGTSTVTGNGRVVVTITEFK